MNLHNIPTTTHKMFKTEWDQTEIWVAANKDNYRITEMTTEHLRNTIDMILYWMTNRIYTPLYTALRSELARREPVNQRTEALEATLQRIPQTEATLLDR